MTEETVFFSHVFMIYMPFVILDLIYQILRNKSASSILQFYKPLLECRVQQQVQN